MKKILLLIVPAELGIFVFSVWKDTTPKPEDTIVRYLAALRAGDTDKYLACVEPSNMGWSGHAELPGPVLIESYEIKAKYYLEEESNSALLPGKQGLLNGDLRILVDQWMNGEHGWDDFTYSYILRFIHRQWMIIEITPPAHMISFKRTLLTCNIAVGPGKPFKSLPCKLVHPQSGLRRGSL